MITGRGNMITIGKFTAIQVNMFIHTMHILEIAFHSDLSPTPSPAGRCKSLPMCCSCARPAMEMRVEPSATAIRSPDGSQSHLRRVSMRCSCKRSCWAAGRALAIARVWARACEPRTVVSLARRPLRSRPCSRKDSSKKSSGAMPTAPARVAHDAVHDESEAIALRSLLGHHETPAPSLLR